MSSSTVYDHIWFESKRSSSLQCCQTFLFLSLLLCNRHPLPPVDGSWHCDCWQSCPYFPSLYLYFALTFRPHWWRNTADCRHSFWKLFFPTLYLNLFLFFVVSKYTAPCSSLRHSALLPSPLSPPLMHFHTSFLPPDVCLIPHLPYFSVASSQANNQLINQLSPRIIVAGLRGAL